MSNGSQGILQSANRLFMVNKWYHMHGSYHMGVHQCLLSETGHNTESINKIFKVVKGLL